MINVYFVRSTGEAFVVESGQPDEDKRIVAHLADRKVPYEVIHLMGPGRFRAMDKEKMDFTSIPPIAYVW